MQRIPNFERLLKSYETYESENLIHLAYFNKHICQRPDQKSKAALLYQRKN